MKCSADELFTAIDRFDGKKVLVVGDIILDRYIWGSVDRISPEAPVPVVEVRRIEDRLGGAANVVRNLAGLGVKASLCGFVGDDDEGRIVLSLLQEAGISKDGVIIDRQKPTCLKTRVIAAAQQVVRIDREDRQVQAAPLQEGFAAVVDAHISDCDGVIFSDYGKGAITETLLKKIVSKPGRFGINKLPLVVDPHPANFQYYHGITVAKPNRKEAERASGVKITDHASAFVAADKLRALWGAELMLITLGELGLVLVGEKFRHALDTLAQDVFDVSGAGDTVTAVFTTALASGASPLVAGDLANIAAGIVVSEIGTVAIDRIRIVHEVERLGVMRAADGAY